MVKLGIIGLGNWGGNLLRNFAQIDDVRIVKCCDLNKERLKAAKKVSPKIEITSNSNEIIEDKEIDAIVVASNSSHHYPLAKAGLNAGKHIFVEKPLSLDSKSALELVKISEKVNKILMVGHLLIYHPAINLLKKIINDGEIGEIYYMYSQRLNLGQIRKDENALISLAPHDISIALLFFESFPESVICYGGTYIQKNIADVVFLILHFPNNRIAQIHLSWLDPHKIRKTTIVGSKKMAVFDDTENIEKIRIYDKGIDKIYYASYGDSLTLRFGDIRIPKVEMKEPLLIECKHFIDCIMQNKKPKTDGYEGYRVVKILEAANKSLKEGGEKVKIINPT